MPKGIYIRTEKIKLSLKIRTNKQYNRPIDNIERFWSYVDIKGLFDCWEWQGSKDRDGYGQFRINKKLVGSHRLAYELYHGKIPDGKQINHKCNNRPCCNPFHIYAGTPQDNVDDMVRAGRQNKLYGELHGMAKLTEKQVVEIRENKNKLSKTKLAKIYNVSRTLIYLIDSRKNWTHI